MLCIVQYFFGYLDNNLHLLPPFTFILFHAVVEILHYTAQIKYLSTYRGHINDDIQGRLKAQLIKAILQFRFD
ncbi:helix-turn-helix domain-containing protein [Blautia sp. Marseille-P3201T]|uniref:helix-turn-helix domain-containing protein n=1 Tax=Blautia sp. Marseille-P3201T TaxID=1907659 RepID=UPI003FA4C930